MDSNHTLEKCAEKYGKESFDENAKIFNEPKRRFYEKENIEPAHRVLKN